MDRYSFKCTDCNGPMQVIDSRPTTVNEKKGIRRRRKCLGCGLRITTFELESARDVDDLRASIGRIMGLARNAEAAISNLVEGYEQLISPQRVRGNDGQS